MNIFCDGRKALCGSTVSVAYYNFTKKEETVLTLHVCLVIQYILKHLQVKLKLDWKIFNVTGRRR